MASESVGTWKLWATAAAASAAVLLMQRRSQCSPRVGDEQHSSVRASTGASKMVFKVVLTGGPCGGKSSSLQNLAAALASRNFDVLCVPEVPTILMSGGCQYPGVDGGQRLVSFETALIQAQLQLERSFVQIAASTGRPTVVLLDRGLLDVGAYLPPATWTDVILKENGLTEALLAKRYDLVLHLVTAADGAEAFYTTANNAARTETAVEARALDAKIRSCYRCHPCLKVIDNTGDFNDKLYCATEHVLRMVGTR